jgi:hypothetical protein
MSVLIIRKTTIGKRMVHNVIMVDKFNPPAKSVAGENTESA